MKKRIVSLSLGVVAAFVFAACGTDKSFDTDLLIGKWSRTSPYATAGNPGDEFYKYNRGGTGATWDTAEDVEEEEAQTFTWTLDKDLLTHLHAMETDPSKTVPKTYTITVLDDKTLTYKDDFGKSFTFKKQ
ncbi:MAG: hypothetical protein FWH36_03450 [Lentimicrobiaceae bacterium]|nr:hypothetical protein [Lentimicrobiaceae bacterium]